MSTLILVAFLCLLGVRPVTILALFLLGAFVYIVGCFLLGIVAIGAIAAMIMGVIL